MGKNIAAQLLGLCGMLFLFLMYQQGERKKLLACKLATDIFWVLHYICLGAYGGAIPNFVGVFRELVFISSDKKWARSKLWCALFIVVNWILAAFMLERPIGIITIVASTAVTISLWIKNPLLTKIICIPVSVCFIVYDCFVGSYVGIVNESIGITSILVSLIKEHSALKPTQKAEKQGN